MLILAGVTIATLTGKNGILARTSEAKENTVVGGEKEQIETVYSAAMINKLGDNVSETEVQVELDKV